MLFRKFPLPDFTIIPAIFCKFVVMKRNLKVTFDFAREATVMLPASKSISNRVLVMNALAGGGGKNSNVAVCDDTDAMQRALRETGDYVNIGAAGTAMRFLTAYFAGCEGRTVTLDGTARMRQRPIGVLVDALRQCGAKISYEGEAGFPPLRIEGRRLHADGPVELAGNVSSQYISALMMVAPGGSVYGRRTDIASEGRHDIASVHRNDSFADAPFRW